MRVAKRPRRGGDMLIKHDLHPAQPLKQEIALRIPRYKQTNKHQNVLKKYYELTFEIFEC